MSQAGKRSARQEKARYAGPVDRRGVIAAVTIIGLWLVSLTALLMWRPFPSWPAVAMAVAWQTFLSTGLFITAHDAMHGTVAPHDRRLNGTLGSVAVTLYAAFSFNRLLREHRRHHQAPGTASDPDFHAARSDNPLLWYVRFVRNYVTWWQILVMAAVFNILAHGLGVAEANLLWFWVLPSLLSTVQLFFFGTYLPHRGRSGGHRDRHNAASNEWPAWLSFVTCYHFGYHWEHHMSPHVPWWKLPSERRRLAGSA